MEKEIHVDKQLSFRKIMELLDLYPDLRKITCPSSLYARISLKYLQALNELGVVVEPVKKKGRPKKYTEEDVHNIKNMLLESKSPREIANILDIPVKTVYYLNDYQLKRGRKSKYDEHTTKKVKKLYNNGLSAKKISENMKIPLRSVYSLLKR
jgi:hypothetical protein